MDILFKVCVSKETDVVRPRTIRIKGRDVSFKKTCGQVLYCDFEELCGRPLWTNDYIKIANTFHTVFIKNIPIMNLKTKSEARRFISLIDMLYENNCSIVILASKPISNLNTISNLAEEFARTSSRLYEMTIVHPGK